MSGMTGYCDRCGHERPLTVFQGRPLCRGCITQYERVVAEFTARPLRMDCGCPACRRGEGDGIVRIDAPDGGAWTS